MPSFDTELLEQIGDVVATEGRAKYNAYSALNDRDILNVQQNALHKLLPSLFPQFLVNPLHRQLLTLLLVIC